MALLRFPDTWTKDQQEAAEYKLNQLAMAMLEVVRQPQENVVFNPIQGKPTPV